MSYGKLHCAACKQHTETVYEMPQGYLCPGCMGPQEPPQDYRIFNRRQPDGTFRPLSEFFDRKEKANG